ncbi:carboxypeptidase-like regulatory domain-containing protein [Sphingobacterium sp. ML3W]|uniref:carboxypeptidase-like regulatory domain-containing protein n=1 Tax=Sphingobacterium sp. ML3W TaxID=1538644 RepID=UPI001184BECC|nr:carboxypeptidase-like regulatory domain-containing protein [Sphingobacterium sp. ML3W]
MNSFKLIILMSLMIGCSPRVYTVRQSIVGYVYDQQHRPLKDVQISFAGNHPFSHLPMKTNENGQFIIPALQFKRYKDVIAVQNGISREIILFKEGFVIDTVSLESTAYYRNVRIADTIQRELVKIKNIN